MPKMFEEEKGKNMNLQDQIDEIIEILGKFTEGSACYIVSKPTYREIYVKLQILKEEINELKP